MTFFQKLEQATGLPVTYSHFKTKQEPPYITYIGAGQYNLGADDTFYYSQNRYQIEYYYTEKNEENERAIEQALLSEKIKYEKSEDIYIEEEGVFVIYYYIN